MKWEEFWWTFTIIKIDKYSVYVTRNHAHPLHAWLYSSIMMMWNITQNSSHCKERFNHLIAYLIGRHDIITYIMSTLWLKHLRIPQKLMRFNFYSTWLFEGLNSIYSSYVSLQMDWQRKLEEKLYWNVCRRVYMSTYIPFMYMYIYLLAYMYIYTFYIYILK